MTLSQLIETDDNDRYTTDSLGGVALWIDRPCEDHWECVIVVMVGDNRRHHVDADDLARIEEDDYCGSCGQTGCGW